MSGDYLVVEVFRFDPSSDERPRYETYEVPYRDGLTVMAAMRYIYERLDPTLAFRDYQCGTAVCTSCTLKINGKVMKSCIKKVMPNETIRVEPRRESQVIRDLVTE